MAVMTVSQITPEFITNMYLYGQPNVPADRANDVLLRPADPTPIVVEVDLVDYMTNGPGRFVSAASFELVRLFFEQGRGLGPGTYTEATLADRLGVRRDLPMQMYDYDDSSSDYGSRVYIWNSVSFEIDERVGLEFVIENDGTRKIRNLSLIPYTNPGETENFDFLTKNWIEQQLNEWLLEKEIDPSKLGRRVDFRFAGSASIISEYTEAQYLNDKANLPSTDGDLLDAASAMRVVSDGLFASGATRFVQDGRAISYGSNDRDSIRGFETRGGADLDEDPHLGEYAAMGVHYVAGRGDDSVEGTSGSDVLDGGGGRDALRGGEGADIYRYTAGDGQDTIIDSDGRGSIEINGAALSGVGAIFTTVNGRRAWRTTVAGQEVFLIEESGSIDSGATVVIQGAALGAGGRIEIRNFVNEQLGIALDTTNQAHFGPASGSLAEGRAITLPVELASIAAVGQVLRFAVDGPIASSLRLVTGAETLAFNPDGTLEVGLVPGQSTYVFSLLARGDVATSENFTLSTVIVDGEGQVVGQSTELSINLVADVEIGAAPVTTNTIDPFDPNSIEGTPDPNNTLVPAAHIYGTGDNDLIYTRSFLGASGFVRTSGELGGSDRIVGADGADTILGGGGSDWISGGAHADWIAGDISASGAAGGDRIEGGLDADILFGRGGDDELWGGVAAANVSAAISGGEIAANLAQRGDFASGEDGNDLVVGSDAWDALSGGAGRDTIVGGGGDDLLMGDRSYALQSQHSVSQVEIAGFTWDWTISRPTDWSQVRVSAAAFAIADSAVPTTSNHEGDADALHGGAGSDAILAGGGDDFAAGGAGADILFGESGSDTLLGGDGNDVLEGGDAADLSGRDFLDGGDGDDRLYGGHADDALFGGHGADRIYGDDVDSAEGDDFIDGEDGADYLNGGVGADTIYGGEGNDELYGDSTNTPVAGYGSDFLSGGTGDDTLVGEGGADTLLGGDGADRLYGESMDTPTAVHDVDYLEGGSGNDLLVGYGGADQLFGGDDDDQLYGDVAGLAAELQDDDYLDGGDGNDQLSGFGGADTLIGGAGNDTLFGDEASAPVALQGADILDGGAGDDQLQGYGGDDHLIGGDGRDVLYGMDGDDYLEGGAGADLLHGGAGDDVYAFDESDLLISGSLADGVIDSEGANRIVIRSGIDSSTAIVQAGPTAGSILITRASADIALIVDHALTGSFEGIQFSDGVVKSGHALIGSSYNAAVTQTSTDASVFLIGGTEDDVLTATGAGSRLSGGQGNDALTGGMGSTTYLYERGDGVDAITDASTFAQTSGAHVNALVLGTGVNLDDLSLRWDAGLGRVTMELGEGDEVRLNSFSASDVTGATRTLDRVHFANGHQLTWGELVAARGITVVNTEALASFSGTNVRDRIYGGSGDEAIDGGAGNDAIDGGAGSDTLSGGAGHDTYVLRLGSGADTINNADPSGTDADRLLIDSSIARSAVDFYRVADSLLVLARNTTDQVFITDYFGAGVLEEIVFADGTTYSPSNLPWQPRPANTLTYNRGDGARTFTITDPTNGVLDELRFGSNVNPASVVVSTNDNGDLLINFRNELGGIDPADRVTVTRAMQGFASRIDQITFAANASMFWSHADVQFRVSRGSGAHDQIRGGDNDDVLAGFGGDDRLDGGGGNDHLDGGDRNDQMHGGSGDDTLETSAGNDNLNGGAGNDVFVVHRGAGSIILGRDADHVTTTDVLRFGPGILPTDLIGTWTGNDVTLRSMSGAFRSVFLNGVLDPTSGDRVIDEIRFDSAPGVVWTVADVRALLGQGTRFGETLVGFSSGDILHGHAGDDVLRGEGGNDTLTGGTGRDSLVGGDGDDTYHSARGDGEDAIYELSGNDSLVFASGIAPTDIQIYRDHIIGGEELLIVVNNSSDRIHMGTTGFEQVVFTGGTTWSGAELLSRAIDRRGTSNGQVGTSGNDVFVVDHPNDTTVEASGGGVDTVQTSVSYRLGSNVENMLMTGDRYTVGYGNALNNELTGNSGNNTLYAESGTDTLRGAAGDDTYYVDAAVVRQVFDDVVIENAGEGYDTILAYAGGGALPANVEQLILSPHYSWVANQPESIVGNALNNVLDTRTFERPDGNTRIYRMDGGAGADEMIGGYSRNTYVVDNAGDIVTELGAAFGHPEQGNDRVESYVSYVLPDVIEDLTLLGSSSISGRGNAGNNEIDGRQNSAANVLEGGLGDDRYVVGVNDTIIEHANQGTDTLVLANSTPSQVFLANYAHVENIEILDTASAISATGTDADNLIVGNQSNNSLAGGGGNDRLYDGLIPLLNGDADYLTGGAGNDELYSGSGADTLDGGRGDDRLNVSANSQSSGSPQFVFGRGYDYDWIHAGRSACQVWFDSSVAPGDLSFSRTGTQLHIHIGATDRLTINFGFTTETGWTFNPNINSFYFQSVSQGWNAAQIVAAVQASTATHPTTADDNIVGTSAADRIETFAGNDSISSGGGNDRIDGQEGNDTLDAGEGDDTLIGSIGADNLFGRAGDDRLDGGAGDDVLSGGAGADTYVFSAFFGSDVIRDSESGQAQDGATDLIEFDASIGRDEMVFSRSTLNASDLWISRRGTGDRITVEGFFANGRTSDQIERIRFADGFELRAEDLLVYEQHLGTDGNDALQAANSPARLLGLGGDDELRGAGGGDLLDGGAGADFMAGGAGNDRYAVDSVGDVVSEAVAGGDDQVHSSVSYVLPVHVERLSLVGTAHIDATGNQLTNHLIGNNGDNRLDGGLGADSMEGGLGNDLFVVDDASDVVVELLNGGVDRVQSTVSYALTDHVEALTLVGSGTIDGVGNALNNQIVGGSGGNLIDGREGADTMSGGVGNDTYIVDNSGDVVMELVAEGTDLVRSAISYTLSEHVENLTLSGSSHIDATGNAGANLLQGNAGRNTLDGASGADTLQGFGGDDTYLVDNAGDVVLEAASEGTDAVRSAISWTLGANVENGVLLGTGSLDATGNELANSLTGNSGNNRLDGGAGADVMNGGLGDDVYVVDAASDVVIENAGSGTDRVESLLTYTLGTNVEHLTLSGVAAINGTGNASSNVLVGNAASNTLTGAAGDDTLDGAAGADTLLGGQGNDIYVVYDAGDVATENASEGTDTLRSTVNWTLGSNFEHLVLLGTANLTGTGNSLANTITGNSGANTLNGGAGADTMIGAAGNDTYVVDNASDVLTENAGEGIDLAQSSVTYSLSANVENLTLTGSGTINATGNSLDNVLTGNSANNTLTGGTGNDTLDGGSGTDTMVGGAGNDAYVVAQSTDVVTENASEGVDTVQTGLTYTLGANVENLVLTGTSTVNGTGNALDNSLTGNSANNTLTGGAGNDTLDGGAGTDTMTGGTGNDTYVVAESTDVVTENASEGTDTVRASISYTAGSNIEHVTLLGSGAINATGNSVANTLTGNSGANTLMGAAGNDTLIGGNGADVYSYSSGHGADVIDNSSTDSAQDRLNVTNLTRSQMTFTRSVNDLVLTRNGTSSDNVRVTNWFTVTGNQLDFVQFTDQTMTAAQINALFGGAMAAPTSMPEITAGEEQPPRSAITTMDNVEDALSALVAIGPKRQGDFRVQLGGRGQGPGAMRTLTDEQGQTAMVRGSAISARDYAVRWARMHMLLDQHLAEAGDAVGGEMAAPLAADDFIHALAGDSINAREAEGRVRATMRSRNHAHLV